MDCGVKNSVLVVDDEKANLMVMANILSSDYSVFMTKNGASAVEMANKYLPDLILLDIILPDTNGFDVLKTLKASEKTKNIPVIIITGLEGSEEEERGLELGSADFIHKPFSSRIVRSKVRNQIQIINQIRELERLNQNLESANRSKPALLAKISHEIRSHLSAILGISEIQLQNKDLPPEMKEAFIRISGSGGQLLRIVNAIFDLSSIEAGKLELAPARYDVESLINDIVFFNLIKYESEPIEFILNVDENIPSSLLGDDTRIKQILNNLLSNAFRSTQTGEVEFSVTVQNENSADNVTLVFRVRDSGHGMTEDDVAKLFDDYDNYDMEIDHAIEGIGLGMGITRNLVQMMNGQINIESKPGAGSVVTVSFPQGNAGAPPLGSKAVEKLRKFHSNQQVKTKIGPVEHEPLPFGKVLLVDDMEINLYIVEEMLSQYELQVDKVTSGIAAIEKIKNNVYDIVFMDHMMPIMDGLEATREIRKLGGKYEELPVVALTANTIPGIREMFLENGFNDYVSKPMGMQELDEIIKKWLSPRKCTPE